MPTNLLQALTNVRRPDQKLDKREVWCLLRFDGNDSTIETFWSESKVEHRINVPEEPGTGKNSIKNITSTGRPTKYVQTEQLVDYPGRHAEEVLCMNLRSLFFHYIAEHGRRPALVEIFLSDSPCLDKSKAWGGFPWGCTFKLLHLPWVYPDVGQWRVYYDKVYNGNNPTDRADAVAGIEHLSQGARMLVAETPPHLRAGTPVVS
jgi:hypothetical protein